jgi:ethanolamine transporter EutH
MLLITGLLCLAMAGMMILCGHLLNRISHLGDLLKSMNDDLNMVSKTMENMHKYEKAKELAKQILKG